MSDTESGVRSRTRRAILAAGARVLAKDRSATLADIAAAAEVGRSTVQRYFPERDELVSAVIEDSLRELGEATAEAAMDEGVPAEAMRRLVAAMLSVSDRVLFLYGDTQVMETFGGVDAEDEGSVAVRFLVTCGQADGSFDPSLTPDWIETVLWSLVYSACDAVGRGAIPRHSAAETVIRTLENGIAGGRT